jgi:hypothetical protein
VPANFGSPISPESPVTQNFPGSPGPAGSALVVDGPDPGVIEASKALLPQAEAEVDVIV